MDINYELYKVFYYVATTMSFSEASKKLYISQSAVSQSVKTLETKLGQPLFVRSTKKVRLTPAGVMLLKHIEPAMNLISRGEDLILNSSAIGMEQLHIGASDTICRYILVPYLKLFHEKFPDVPLKVTNATSIECVSLLSQQKVDLIISNSPNTYLNNSYVIKTIGEFQDVFIAARKHFPLEEKELSLKELSGYPLMTLDRNSTTSEFLQQLFLQHQIDFMPQIELSSNDLLIDLARIGLGIAFVPDYCLREKDKALFRISVSEPLPRRSIVAAVNPSMPQSSATSEFLKLFQNASI